MNEEERSFEKITESESPHRNLEQRTVAELLTLINSEDQGVPAAVARVLPAIEPFVEAVAEKMAEGGRLFYIGAGTSGRLGVLDASECPPTFGVPAGIVVGIIAGGAPALQQAVEGAEDDLAQGWLDLEAGGINALDSVLGIAASGTTPYVLGALRACRQRGILTGSLCCNPGAPLGGLADYPIEVLVGPELVTGSTRMKSGTAQKLVLNMISTTLMIRLGRVEDNRMVHMQLSNEKLVDRGVRMLMERAPMGDYETAKALLLQAGSVRKALARLGM